MAKIMSLDEALNIFKGNLSLLSSDQIKAAKSVINELGTPADKFFIEALTKGDVLDADKTTYTSLAKMPEEINNSALSQQEKLKARRHWNNFAKNILNDVAKDDGQNIQPEAYADIEALAEVVYNGDEKEKSAKDAVLNAINNSRRIFDEENGLNAPQAVLDSNSEILETLEAEIKAEIAAGRTPDAVREAQTIAANFKPEDNAAEPGEEYNSDAFMDMVWDNAAIELLGNEEFNKATPEKKREIYLNHIRVAAHAEAAAIIIAQETSQDKEVIRKTISESVKAGDINTKEGVRSLFSSFIEKSAGVKNAVVNKLYSKVTAGKILPATEKVAVKKKGWLQTLSAHSARLDNLQARISEKFKTKTKVGQFLSKRFDDFSKKHPFWAGCAKVAGKVSPSLLVSGAVMLSAGTGIALPIAAFAAAYRIRRSTKKFFADYHQEAEKDPTLTLRSWWKNADKKKKLLLGSAIVGGIGFIGSSAILAGDMINTTVDAADTVNTLNDVNIADTLKTSGKIVRKVQMASGMILGAVGGTMAYKEFKKMYKEMSPEDQKALKKKLKVGGIIGAVSLGVVYAGYKLYDTNETNNINELLAGLSDNAKLPKGINVDRALLTLRHFINDQTMRNVELPEGISRENMSLGNLDDEAKKQLLFNILKTQGIDRESELSDALLNGELHNNPQAVAEAFNKLNSFNEIINPRTGEAYTEAEILKLKPEQMANQVKDYIVTNKEINSLSDIAAKEFDPVVAEAELDNEAVTTFNAEFQQEAGIGGGLGGVGGYLLVGAGLGTLKKNQLKAKWAAMSKGQKTAWGIGALGLGALAYWAGSEAGDAWDRDTVLDNVNEQGLGEGIDYTRALKSLGIADEVLKDKSDDELRDLLNEQLKVTTDDPDKFLDLVIANELKGAEEHAQILFTRLTNVGEIELPEGVKADEALKDGTYINYLRDRITDIHGTEQNGIDVKDIESLEQLADVREVGKIVDSQGETVLESWKKLTGKEDLSLDKINKKLLELAKDTKEFFIKTADDIEKLFWKEEFAELEKNKTFMAYAGKLNTGGKGLEDYLREHDLGNGKDLSGIQSYLVNQSVNGIETEQLQSVLNSAHANGLVTDDMLPEVDEEKVAFADLTEEQQRDVLKAVINADNSNEDAIKDVADLQAHIKDLELDKALEGLDGKADIAKELGIEGSGEDGAVTDEDIKTYMNSNSLETTEALQAEAELHKEIGSIPAAEKDVLAEHLGIDKDELDEGTSLDDEIRSQMKAKGFDSVEELKADKALTDEFKTIDGDNNGLTTAYKDNLVELGYGDAEDGVTVDEVKDFMKIHDLNTKAELDAYIAQQTAPVTLTDEQVNLLGAAENGVKVELPQVDENGNPVLGEDGKPVMEDKTADVKSALESLKENGKYENITRHDMEEALKGKGFNDKQIEQISSQLNENKVAEAPVTTQEQVVSNDGTPVNTNTGNEIDSSTFSADEKAMYNNSVSKWNNDAIAKQVAKLEKQGYKISPEIKKALENAGKDNIAGVKGFYDMIAVGNVESLPNGVSAVEYVDKLTRMAQLAPYVQKEAIDIMLKELICADFHPSAEQIATVQTALGTIIYEDGKMPCVIEDANGNLCVQQMSRFGQYVGPQQVAKVTIDGKQVEVPVRTANITLSLSVKGNCDESLKIHSVYMKQNVDCGCEPKNIKVGETVVPTSTVVPNTEVIELPLQQTGVSLTFGQNNITEFQATVAEGRKDIIEYHEQYSNTPRSFHTHSQLYNIEEARANNVELPKNGLAYDKNGDVYRIVNGTIYDGEDGAGRFKIGKIYPKVDENGNLLKDEQGKTVFERTKDGSIKVKKGLLGGSALETSVETVSVPAKAYEASPETINSFITTHLGANAKMNELIPLEKTAGTSTYYMATKHGLVELAVNEKTGEVQSFIGSYDNNNEAPNLPKETQEALYKEAQEKLKAIHTAGVNAADAANYQHTLLDVVGSKDWPNYEIHGVKGSEMLVMKAEHGVITVNGGKMEYLHEGSVGEATHQADLANAQKALETYNKAEAISKTGTQQLDNTATRRLGINGRFNFNNTFNKGTSR